MACGDGRVSIGQVGGDPDLMGEHRPVGLRGHQDGWAGIVDPEWDRQALGFVA